MRNQFVHRFFTQILLCLFMAGFGSAACAQSKSVSVLTVNADNVLTDSVTDARLSVMRDGIRDALKANSFQEGKSFKLQFLKSRYGFSAVIVFIKDAKGEDKIPIFIFKIL